MSIPGKKSRGSILVTILLMTSVLALLVAAVASDSFQSLKSVAQSGRDTQAKYAAYAGMERALNELRKKESFIGTEISERHGEMEGQMAGLEQLRYRVLVWNNIQERDSEGKVVGDALEDLPGPDGVTVHPDTVYIVSSGNDVTRGEEVILSSLAGTARRVRPVFEDAAFARTKLAFSGSESLVDAWDSEGGWNSYVEGDFPGDPGGGGGGGGPNEPSPTVEDYKATLGTDAAAGRTLRLLGDAKLNGYYRVGPGVAEAQAFGDDGGSSSGGTSPFGGTSETTYAVTTAQSVDQIAGQEPTGGVGLGEEKAMVDTKTTEVPRFVSPYSDTDVVPGPTLNNPSTVKKDDQGKVEKDWNGNPIILPPAPVQLPPGGYESINVPNGQTLELTAGVYFFKEDFLVNGGKVITSGGGPAIVFCGKKATFIDASVNEEGRTSSLQLCFTDNDHDDDTLTQLSEELSDIFAGTATTTTSGDAGPENYKNLISPLIQEGDEEAGVAGERRGFSKLEISGDTKYYGSISGENLVAIMNGGEVFGSIMANVIKGENAKLHQDLSLKGSNLMAAGGWKLEGVHQVR